MAIRTLVRNTTNAVINLTVLDDHGGKNLWPRPKSHYPVPLSCVHIQSCICTEVGTHFILLQLFPWLVCTITICVCTPWSCQVRERLWYPKRERKRERERERERRGRERKRKEREGGREGEERERERGLKRERERDKKKDSKERERGRERRVQSL